jgi:hypothetical protein
MLFHNKDAAAVTKGSGALAFLYIFLVTFSAAIAKERRLEPAASIFLLGHWYVDARFGHANMELFTPALPEDC